MLLDDNHNLIKNKVGSSNWHARC